jgi:hypothetical protein
MANLMANLVIRVRPFTQSEETKQTGLSSDTSDSLMQDFSPSQILNLWEH